MICAGVGLGLGLFWSGAETRPLLTFDSYLGCVLRYDHIR